VVANEVGFNQRIETLEELVAVCGEPEDTTRTKILNHLDQHCRTFISLSPFVLIGTTDTAGNCDVSPRGGPSGFVEVLDPHRLVFADAKGNRLADSLRNICETGRAGLLFMIPGMNETLRVNGRACLTEDPQILARHMVQEGRPPKLAVGVDVEVAFLHCAKALIRSGLWREDAWPDRDRLPRPAQIWKDHIGLNMTTDEIEQWTDEAYRNELY
jgi:PPOX class probable FMN-dependent enzyme